MTGSQQDRLDALLKALGQSRERARADVAELFPQLNELLQQSEFSSNALATVLRSGLKSLDAEVEAIAVPASEFFSSLDATQRETVRGMLRRRVG
jgi:hypothetical protein